MDELFGEQPSEYGLHLASLEIERLTWLGFWWARGVVDQLRQQSGACPIDREDWDG